MKFSDKEYEEKYAKVAAFKNDLKQLFLKHKIGITSIDDYDNEDNYSNTSYLLTFDGQTWYSEGVEEILNELWDDIKNRK
jgi:hypothetical protein